MTFQRKTDTFRAQAWTPDPGSVRSAKILVRFALDLPSFRKCRTVCERPQGRETVTSFWCRLPSPPPDPIWRDVRTKNPCLKSLSSSKRGVRQNGHGALPPWHTPKSLSDLPSICPHLGSAVQCVNDLRDVKLGDSRSCFGPKIGLSFM